MEQINEVLFCLGCGAKIQSEDPEKTGYTPKSTLAKEDVLCKRCFRLKHYNEIQDVDITDDDFLKMVSSIQNKRGLVVHLIDIFDVNGSLLTNLPRIVGENPILLVGNKQDLLPKSTNERHLIQWLRRSAKEMGLKVIDVALISSKKGHGMEALSNMIETYRKGQDVFIVGTTNVGKSTFINRLIKHSTGENDVITTSYFPGTTLGFIEIPLDAKSHMIDTPGIVNRKQLSHYVSENDLKLIHPTKEIKPRVYQLNAEQTLFFGGLARIDFIKGDRKSFICYFSNRLPIHRTKLAKADELYNNHLGQMLAPPDETTQSMLPPLVKHSFRLQTGKSDIVFPGLGWVSVAGEKITVEIHAPRGIAVSLREALI
ncbi:MAG TPA: ribosome biogenesis GTPase YqeH [Cerasibacillus sp.]|uniref:ribosome biogenesis GTPase YqeH n=1 Tax=Cerasibacillus sp. TaxID=2498711 RepID=UPI002F3F4E6A